MKVEKVLGDWYEENCYVVSYDNSCLIIDPGAKLEKVLPLIEGKKVEGILLTHGHFDHTMYLEEYAKFFKVKIYGSEKVVETLKDKSLNQSKDLCIKDIDINCLYGDGKIQVGEFDIEYFACPGHSPCCECYKIGDLLFGGDVLFNSGIGRLDLKGASKEDMISSLEKLSRVEFSTLFSGHGEESSFDRQKRNIAVFTRFLKR